MVVSVREWVRPHRSQRIPNGPGVKVSRATWSDAALPQAEIIWSGVSVNQHIQPVVACSAADGIGKDRQRLAGYVVDPRELRMWRQRQDVELRNQFVPFGDCEPDV